ncbi:hypothetical protein TIFTF001_044284 [Ficus carica]|uniref:Uncharacterized protein n=1 Tax=Ficus carica TaxID=3494 RepID=A0AA87Z4Y5_FICCA|nr:hypothetical protein TIFTF001_044284 [Ficus carica]
MTYYQNEARETVSLAEKVHGGGSKNWAAEELDVMFVEVCGGS